MKRQEIKIAIVDDQENSRQINTKRLNNLASCMNLIFDISEYESGTGFLACENEFDLVLLDFEMPNKNGTEVARDMEIYGKRAKILFVSGYEKPMDIMQEGMQINNVIGFVFKHSDETEFHHQVKSAIEKIIHRYWIEIEYHFVDHATSEIKNREARIRHIKTIDARTITYIRTESKDVTIISTKEDNFSITMSLKKILEGLPEDEFAYTERKAIVNLRLVYSIGKKTIELYDGQNFKLSPKYRKEFVQSYNHYLMKG